ncbi:hypothetical protein HERIO_1163 [Hepatospora eriocheir]|uniref:Uncharacterized protein n=1 Tax=Hepatospora eriocheir TaxID=1081669 RepID=A0A1X0QB05_9MICR|nr:hypothetical protein HERIO_1163 [Hepatospora eriocheir]
MNIFARSKERNNHNDKQNDNIIGIKDTIPIDIALLISNYESRLRDMFFPDKNDGVYLNLFSHLKTAATTSLDDNCVVVFKDLFEFKFIKNLENVQIDEIIFCRIEKFTFNNIITPYHKSCSIMSPLINPKCIFIECLTLKTCLISFLNLIKLIRICKPTELRLQDVKFDGNLSNLKEFIKVINYTKINSLTIKNTSFTKDNLKEIIRNCKLINVEFQIDADLFKLFILNSDYINSLFYADCSFTDIDNIDTSTIQQVIVSNARSFDFLVKFPRCQFLEISQCCFGPNDNDLIEKMELVRLKFSNVKFLSASVFYQIIMTHYKTLRYLEFIETILPFDAEEYCYQNLIDCKVILSNIMFYIGRK